jgi:hypothetical protein
MNELTQEQKEALERFKQTKDNPETIAGFFYKLLEGADPIFKEFMEEKAAVMMHAGYKIGEELAASENDPKKKAEVAKKLQALASKINSSVQKNTKKENREE